MKTDSDLLDQAIEENLSEPILRLYGWSPACVSLGRNQNESFINKDILKKHGIDCVRRITGGRALLHDNELTYSYITPINAIDGGDNISKSYTYISGIWIKVFEKLDISLNFGGANRHITKNNYCMAISTGADLCFGDKKFIGSAQCRKNGYILQHGSILIDYDKEKLNTIFNEATDFSTITTLKEINKNISVQNIIDTVKSIL